MNGKGKCFINTATAVLEGRTDCTVCHGVVTGTAEKVLGVKYPHAWLEVEIDLTEIGGATIAVCVDTTHKLGPLPVSYYYQVGKIDPESVIRYTPEQVKEMCIRHETYGPWHESLWDCIRQIEEDAA